MAPLAPAIAFSVVFAIYFLLWSFYEASPKNGHVDLVLTIFLSLYWLMFAIPISYLITFVFGIPAFFIYRKLNLTDLRSCLIGAGLVGILAAMIIIFYFWWFDYWGLFIGLFGMLSGMLTGSVFWRIVYKTSAPLDW